MRHSLLGKNSRNRRRLCLPLCASSPLLLRRGWVPTRPALDGPKARLVTLLDGKRSHRLSRAWGRPAEAAAASRGSRCRARRLDKFDSLPAGGDSAIGTIGRGGAAVFFVLLLTICWADPLLPFTRSRLPVSWSLRSITGLALRPPRSPLRLRSGLKASGALLPARRGAGVAVLVQTEHHCGRSSAEILAWPEANPPKPWLPHLHPGRSGRFHRPFRESGLAAARLPVPRSSRLSRIGAGQPVLIWRTGFTWVPLWHYSVLTAYDLDRGIATLFARSRRKPCRSRPSPAPGQRRLLCAPGPAPGRLPETNDPEGILAAWPTSRVGHAEAAIQVRVVSAEVAENWRGRSLGQCAPRRGGSIGAEAFRRAHGTAPERPSR